MAKPFAAGFELGERYSQICCKNADMKEPVSISQVEGTEKYRIPTESLEKFMKKSLRLLKPYGKLHEAGAAVFTVERSGGETAETVRNTVMQITGLPESRIFVQGPDESFCAYVLSQPREIWRHQALLFTCAGEFLQAAALKVNPRTSPMVARIERPDGWSVPVSGLAPDEKDQVFLTLVRDILAQRQVSSAFLVGESFEERWYDDTLRLLLGSGRRVFAGNNLFAKGACYRAMQEAAHEKPYIFLGADKICYNVGLKVPGSGQRAVYSLLDAGTSWYEAKASCEAILVGEPVVEFILVPIKGQELLRESVQLDGLPKRPGKTTRLHIEAAFTGADTLKIYIKDMGFGELFPSSDLEWTEELGLGGGMDDMRDE